MLLSSASRAFASMRDIRQHMMQDGQVISLTGTVREKSKMPPPLVIWGPVPHAVAKASGAHTPASSVLLRPAKREAIMSGVRALIPDAVFPRSDDTPWTLANRLSGCNWLDGELAIARVGKSGGVHDVVSCASFRVCCLLTNECPRCLTRRHTCAAIRKERQSHETERIMFAAASTGDLVCSGW